MADKDRVAITIKRLNTEKDKTKPKKYEWQLVRKKAGHYKSTQVDHVLEIQRFESLFEKKDVPHDAGKQGAWDIMRKAVSLETKVSEIRFLCRLFTVKLMNWTLTE